MIIRDEGEYEPLDDFAGGLAAGAIRFGLHGRKLSGEFALLRLKKRTEKEWLLIKKKG
jgi:bifunctional non-homologous end joining protein LigD